MAINETIITGRKYRRLIDVATRLWERISFWTKASDVEFDDGKSAQAKVGAIKGITTSISVTETGYAIDASMIPDIYAKIEEVKQVGYEAGYNAGLKDNNNTNIAAIIDPNDVHIYNGGDSLNITISKRSAVYVYGSVPSWRWDNCGTDHEARINLKVGTSVVKTSYVKARETNKDDQGNTSISGDGTSCSWSGAVNSGTVIRVEMSLSGYYNDRGFCSPSSQVIVIGYK